jgi:hypothetical protein
MNAGRRFVLHRPGPRQLGVRRGQSLLSTLDGGIAANFREQSSGDKSVIQRLTSDRAKISAREVYVVFFGNSYFVKYSRDR